ncbi:flagellin [Methylorubrum extorquens]|uniref:flagellin N-terminal helical domain-containing protein n=1 Tax=Methylorubrum extorquens TaxID=408 RepID=UPI003F64613D
MSSGITLSSATRQNLLSLQDTSALTATTQNRLATGLKVSSALDSPVNFFTAQNLSNRSTDLGGLLDGISNGVQAIQAANQGITSIQKLIDSAKSTANQALSTQITTTGTAATDFAASTTSATTVSFFVNGTSKTATIATSSTIDAAITSLNTAAGSTMFSKDTTGKKIVLNASSAVEFATTGSQTALGFDAGTGTATADKYGTGNTVAGNSANLTISGVENRQDFTKRLVNILDTGASNLTNADLNEEAANSQALSTRQSLGISALSLANQAQQGILQLLR